MQKKKLLLIAHFDQKSGWGIASNSLAEALNNHPDIDLSCRTVSLSGQGPWNETVKKLHEKTSLGSEYCIQLLLPHHMEYGAFKKCIGMFYNETYSYQYSSWPQSLNLMDEIWVPYFNFAHEISGVRKPIKIINHPVNMSVYQTEESVDMPKEFRDGIDGTFSFYFIGELNKRKNLPGLLRAFHSEFGTHENVSLVIKSSIAGESPEVARREISELCLRTKEGLKLRSRYHNEIISTSYLSEPQMRELHRSCNCFVTASRGEAICIPLMDAIGFGNYIVAPIHMGTGHIINSIDKSRCGAVSSHQEYVFGETRTFSDLFTGHETWGEVDQFSLRAAMREQYTMWKNGAKPYYSREKFIELFSYESVAESIVKALDD